MCPSKWGLARCDLVGWLKMTYATAFWTNWSGLIAQACNIGKIAKSPYIMVLWIMYLTQKSLTFKHI